MSLIRTCHDFEQYVAECRNEGITPDDKGFVEWCAQQQKETLIHKEKVGRT